MSFAAGTPLHGALSQGLRKSKLCVRDNNCRGTDIALRPIATMSRDRLRVHTTDTEAYRLESTDAFAELKKLAQKQSVNRPQDVRILDTEKRKYIVNAMYCYFGMNAAARVLQTGGNLLIRRACMHVPLNSIIIIQDATRACHILYVCACSQSD